MNRFDVFVDCFQSLTEQTEVFFADPVFPSDVDPSEPYSFGPLDPDPHSNTGKIRV